VFRIAMAPTFVVLGVAWASSSAAASCAAQRGRPDTWLYRQLQWRIATRHPLMAGWVGRPCADLALGLLVHPQGGTMSRFKNEIAHLQAHIKTLAPGCGRAVRRRAGLGGGWWSAPRDLTIHVPPDLRSGSTRKWWEVPPESVYAFTFYVFQTLNRWPTNGEEDYPRNLHTLSPYLTPSCQAFLRADYDYRRSHGRAAPARARHLRDSRPRLRRRPHGARARVSDRDWVVTLDISADEYYGAEQVKRALVRYPIKVAGGRRSRAQPLRPGAGLLRRRAPAHQRTGADAPGAGGLSPQAPQGGNTP
jgi:integrating conjugative element protein (TIGR03746 family)